MTGAGYERQALDQPNQADIVNRWYTEQAKGDPARLWEELAKYMGIVGNNNWGQYGTVTEQGTSTTTKSGGGNPFKDILGGVMGMFGSGGPFGAGGAFAGALGGGW